MIRPATVSDIQALVTLCGEFHREARWDWVDYDPDSMAASLGAWIGNDMARVLVWDDGQIQGFIIGFVTPMFCNAAVTVAHELLWWVKPEQRNGIGGELLAAFHQGADYGFQTVSETTPRCDVVKRKLRMAGWQPLETNFIKGLG